MVGCIPEVLTLLLTPILTYLYMSYARCHVCHICQICHIWHIWHVWCSDIHHMYVCQYGCQKKRWDLSNTVRYLKHVTYFSSGLKFEKSYFLEFPLYFSEFPLYSSLYWRVIKIVTFQIKFFGTCYWYNIQWHIPFKKSKFYFHYFWQTL